MTVLTLLSLVFLSSVAQSIVCTIEGTTTDTETKHLYLVESGADIRVKDDVITIPVVNGKFHYIWKGDEKLYFQLIADNQYQNGNIRAAFFIAENQQVVVKMGRADDKVVVNADGKETKMLQRCQKVMDAVYASRMAAMDEKMDSLEQLLERYMSDLSPSEQEQFIAELEMPHSSHPLVAAYQQTEQAYRELIADERFATAKWLDAHPCIYGLFYMKDMLAISKSQTDAFTCFLIRSYQQTYSHKYPQHPYHTDIQSIVQSLALQPGNQYIDYDVSLPDGKQAAISTLFTGEIIYIDLWASWCGPCRRHAKELMPVYEKYKDKGFQIIGIARESNAEDMQEAIQKDGYPWLCLLELNDRNRIWLKNGISNSVGGGFLITKDGKILSVYPSAEETERILSERMSK
ncbi:MAG: redoxin family protein [Alloprevotella sp.]